MKETSPSKVPIASVAKVISGYAFKSSEFKQQGIPVIKIRNIGTGTIDFSETQCVSNRYLSLDPKYRVQGDDILISLTGSHINQPNSVVGRVARYPRGLQIALLNQRAGKVIIKDSERCDASFLYYYLFDEKTRRDIAAFAHGAANQANVSPSQIESLEIILPPPLIQRKIASILSAYDDLIDNNQRRINILEEMAQTLYREWFVKFRFPGHEKVKMVNSSLGKIPQGWEVKTIGDAIELAYGKALKEENRQRGIIPVYGSSGVVGYHNEHYVKGPGIIVGRKGNVGSVFWCDTDFWPIDTVFFVQTKISLAYVYYNLQRQNFINNDAAVPGLNRNAAYLKPFLVPNDRLLVAFEKYLTPIFRQLRTMQSKNTNLRRTRDLLLPKLISGEIDVEKMDIDVGGLGG
jgi:type I restriction enzyme S subunit